MFSQGAHFFVLTKTRLGETLRIVILAAIVIRGFFFGRAHFFWVRRPLDRIPRYRFYGKRDWWFFFAIGVIFFFCQKVIKREHPEYVFFTMAEGGKKGCFKKGTLLSKRNIFWKTDRVLLLLEMGEKVILYGALFFIDKGPDLEKHFESFL